jgi:hypothetical protein
MSAVWEPISLASVGPAAVAFAIPSDSWRSHLLPDVHPAPQTFSFTTAATAAAVATGFRFELHKGGNRYQVGFWNGLLGSK